MSTPKIRPSRRVRSVSLSSLATLLSLSAVAQQPAATLYESTKLIADAGSSGDFFNAPALDGNTLVVGAPLEDTYGVAYVYSRSGVSWVLQQRIPPPSGNTSRNFGSRLALQGNTLVITAVSIDQCCPEAAYVYVRNSTTWSLQAKLTASDAQFGQNFGMSVDIDSDTIAIGASRHNGRTGQVYVFVRTGTTWTEQVRFLGSGVGSFGRFGQKLDLDGDLLATSAWSQGAGVGFVFERTGSVWDEKFRVTPTSVGNGDGFGRSVALDGNTLVFGAPFVHSNTGSVYVYERVGTSWQESDELTASDGSAGDWFGESLLLSGNTMIVGAEYFEARTGIAYVFTRSGPLFEERVKLSPCDGAVGDAFSNGMSISWPTVAIGSFFNDNANGADAGAVYVFEDVFAAPTPQSVACDKTPPVAVAGDDQCVHVGNTAVLDGTNSHDNTTTTGDLLFAWSFVTRPAGSSATLQGASSAVAQFELDVAGAFELELVVTDEAGNSSPPNVIVVSSKNGAPTADAGVDTITAVGNSTELDGLGSMDPDADPITYDWVILSKPPGSTAALAGSATAVPSLTPDQIGTYEVQLIVFDGYAYSVPDSVVITAISGAEYAENLLAEVSTCIVEAPDAVFAAPGHRNYFANNLRKTTNFIRSGKTANAKEHMVKLIERTDGWPLRGRADPKGSGQSFAADFLLDRDKQLAVYDKIAAALGALGG